MFLNCDAKVRLFFESANVLRFFFFKSPFFFFLLLQLTLEIDHLDGRYGTFVALVAQTSTGTVFGLLHVVGGDKAVDYRNVSRCIEVRDTLGGSGTYIVEVGGIASNYATDGNNGIYLAALNHLG